MTVDRKRLRELALAATPGPWRFSPWHVEEGPAAVRKDGYGYISSGFASDATAEYVAAANPQTILALLDALDAAEQPTDDARDAARYRLIREGNDRGFVPGVRIGAWMSKASTDADDTYPSAEDLDAAIDAAIAEQAKERAPSTPPTDVAI